MVFLKSGQVRNVYECESPQGKYFVSILGHSEDIMWVLEVKGEYYVKETRRRISICHRSHKDILCHWLKLGNYQSVRDIVKLLCECW